MTKRLKYNLPTRYWSMAALLAILILPFSVQAASISYDVHQLVTNDWTSGYNADITIKNTGSAPIRDWQLAFDYPQKITSLWNGSISSHQGTRYIVANAGWNSVIEPGQTVTVGLTAQANDTPIQAPANVNVSSKADDNNPPDNGSGDFTVNASANSWDDGFNGKIDIINNSKKPITNWRLSFNSPAKITSAWSADMQAQGNTYVFNNAGWNGTIAPGATASFGYSAEGKFSPLTQCMINGVPCSGENVSGGGGEEFNRSVEISFPNAPAGVTSAPSVTLTGATYPNGKTYSGDWAKPLVVSYLADGSYQVSGSMLNTDTDSYRPEFTPSTITLSAEAPTAQVTVHYVVKEKGQLAIQVMDKPQAVKDSTVIPEIQITNVTQNNKAVKAPALAWGSISKSDPLIAGDEYKITATTLQLADGTLLVPSVTPETVTVAANTSTPIALTYQVQAPPPVETGQVQVTVNGVPTANDVALTFNETISNKKINQTVASTGGKLDLPVGNYSVSATTINFNSENYYASAQPAIVSVSKATPAELAITYSKAPANQQRYIVYWTSWQALPMVGTPGVDGLPTNITAVNLSFADIDPSTLAVKGSDRMLDEPNFDPYWMPPQYIMWTTYKHQYPQVKMLAAFGGQTYEHLWNSTLTADNVEAIAKNMVAAVTKDYPVYLKVGGKYQPAGFVQLDGIDLDVEASIRMTPEVANNVVRLIKALRANLPAGKVISITGFSVGADPASCQFGGDPASGCTFPGSQWSGEMIPVLQQAGADVDWVNDMAYDAGQHYNYQLSVENYAKYVPKEKVVFGLTIGDQWGTPRFTESMEELLARTAWEKLNGYGGVFVWALGSSNTEPYVKLKQIGDQLK